MATVDLQSTNESGMLYYDHEQIKGQLNGLDTSDSINDKLNGITNTINNKTGVWVKSFSDATEYSSSSQTDSVNFTLTVPVGSYITQMYLKHDVKCSHSSSLTFTNLKLSGTNFGTKYIHGNLEYGTVESSSYQSGVITSSYMMSSSFNPNTAFGGGKNQVYRTYTANPCIPIKVLDANTTITIRYQPGSGTGYVKNVELIVMGVYPVEEL